MSTIGSGPSIGRIGRSGGDPHHLRLGLVTIAVTLVGASGLLFDASTPRTVEVTLFYVAMVLVGFWLLQPKAPLALALLATLLIALGSWVSPPDPAPAWEAWTNRGLSVCAVWLAGVFVWRFRVIEQELRRSEERFRSSVVQSPVPTILYDDREQVLAVSRSWLNAAGGISANELYRLEDWTTIAYGERSGEMLDLVRRIIATEPEAQTDELVVRRRTGDNRVWHFVTSGLGAKSDGRHLFISVAQDVTDRKAYEERIELLMREARHRTKNILGLVQAVARQTAAREPEQFVESLSERIQALAANQDLLGRHEWQQIAVKDLVQVQLEHFDDLIGTRINFDGPNLHLNAAAAQSIGLALHELATNAGKYGALSTEAGRVDVSWQLDDDTYMMGWIERDGPLVQSPKRRGFGSTVIESMLQRALGGEVQLDYAPSGLQWRLTCPKANALELTDDSHNGGPA